jgi:hypothetical protein
MPSFSIVTEVFTAVGSIATAAGVIAAFVQLRLNGKQARFTFEESLIARYHHIVAAMPVWAFFDTELTHEQKAEIAANSTLSAFYRYLDLCNEQIYLRQQQWLDDATWREWRQGIVANLRRPAFRWAWEHLLVDKIGADFGELKGLYAEIVPASRPHHSPAIEENAA